jgi:DNA-binding GntR family transcriptional regulator
MSRSIGVDAEPDPLDGIGNLPGAAMVHVYDHVYRLVRHALLLRRVAPGTRVVEAALARQLHVSRTPVRDAMRRLESDGLLERTAGGGLNAATFSDDELKDLFLVRTRLDELAAELAAKRTKAQDWDRVRDVARLLGPIVSKSGVGSYEFSEAHDQVHAAIYARAFSPRVAKIVSARIMGLVEIAGGLSYRQGRNEPVVAQHLELIDALASGSVRRARAAAADHVAAAEKAAGETKG